jgi:hypothetical protein
MGKQVNIKERKGNTVKGDSSALSAMFLLEGKITLRQLRVAWKMWFRMQTSGGSL